MSDATGPRDLPPSDELVRGWLDDGLRDSEIAVRLGISNGEARARVARVRAAVQPERTPTEGALGPGTSRCSEPRQDSTSAVPRRALALGIAGTLALAGVAFLALVLIGDSQGARLADGQPQAATGPTAAATLPEPTPSPTPVAPVLEGVRFEELRLGGPALLPGDTAMILESNCERCLWDTGLYRLRTVDGQPVIETLFLPPDAGFMDSVYAAKDGSTIVLATGSARTRSFQRSEDGGVTWQPAGEVAGDIAFLEAVGPAHLRVRVVDRGVESIVQLPEGLNARETALDPALVPWVVYSGIEKREPPAMGPYRYTSWAAIPGGNAAVMIIPPFGPANTGALAIFNAAGRLVSGYANTPYGVLGMVSPNLVAATVEMPTSREIVGPALINIATGSVHALRGPWGSSLATLRIRAVQTGPFLFVRHSGQPCVPVTDAWNSDSAREVACAAPGVLLRDTGTTARRATGEEWAFVETPAGLRGWIQKANTEALGER